MITTRKECKPYAPYGAALQAWKSRRREVLLAGPGDTGKSRLILEKLNFCADKYPKSRMLMVRKTRKSLTQAAMVTYEQRVLPDGWLGSLIRFNTTDQQYEYPNGSIIAVAGMDDPAKVLSSEWDMIYPQEATELTENDWEYLTMRLRNGAMPYQQIIADCNPSYPTHWLKARCDRGATLMLYSRHEDNPSITEERLNTLRALTGVRYLRLYLGQWAAAEGMVYDEWDRPTHVVSKQKLVEWGVFKSDGSLNRDVIQRVVAGVDWGFKNPGVIQVYGLDGDTRIYLLCEVYRTRRTIDWWLEQAKALDKEFGIETFICDPSEPAYIKQFYDNNLYAIGAINDIAPGIDAVKYRLKVAGDGRPRLFVYEESLRERDELREADRQPYCLEQEIDAYAYPQNKDGQMVKEVPVKINDHGVDVLRYVCKWIDRDDSPIAISMSGDSGCKAENQQQDESEALTKRIDISRLLGNI